MHATDSCLWICLKKCGGNQIRAIKEHMILQFSALHPTPFAPFGPVLRNAEVRVSWTTSVMFSQQWYQHVTKPWCEFRWTRSPHFLQVVAQNSVANLGMN